MGTSWLGSLVANKHDGSGLVSMRNRYLNPQTGQFTQTDPIGLAGGLNLYGYAGGDPVNSSDPFGLCPLDETGIPCVNIVKGVVGAVNILRAVGKLQEAGVAAALGRAELSAGLLVQASSNTRRGILQVRESQDDANGPSARNLLGLLPNGQMFDDPGEPTVGQYIGDLMDRFTTDPRDALGKLARDYMVISPPKRDEEERR